MPTERDREDRWISAMGERVARVETKIEGIEKSIDVIRESSHAIRNELQKITGAEERRDAKIITIADQTLHLPDLMAQSRLLDELRPQLQALINESEARKGAWKAICMLGAAIIGAVTVIATILGGVVWVYGRVTGQH